MWPYPSGVVTERSCVFRRITRRGAVASYRHRSFAPEEVITVAKQAHMDAAKLHTDAAGQHITAASKHDTVITMMPLNTPSRPMRHL